MREFSAARGAGLWQSAGNVGPGKISAEKALFRVGPSRRLARGLQFAREYDIHPSKVGKRIVAETPENLVLELLRNLRAEVASTRSELSDKIDRLRADVASDFVTVNARIDSLRKETSEQIVGLRRAVVEYHSSVVGHGMLISELDARMRRVETHLGLPAFEAH